MASKRLKIENLDNLHELSAEELSPIQGGLSVETELEASQPSLESELRIAPDDRLPIEPYPLPIEPWPCDSYKPNKRLPYYPCRCSPYPTKDGLPWCAVIL